MATKTIGVIGLGSIGMRHAKNLLAMGHKVWGFDPDDERGMELLKAGGLVTGFAHGHKSTVTDWLAAMRDQFDGIVVASPTINHHDHLAISVLNKNPVLVEKPLMDRDPHPALDLSSVTVGYNLRFHSCVKKAKEWMDAGLIGEPLWANFTCAQYNDKPAYLRDGVILNWSHEIDLALYLLGPAKVAASSTHLTDGKDDATDILLTHVSGTRTSIHLDYVTKPDQRGFNIVGTKNSISANLVSRTVSSISANLVSRTVSMPRNYGDNLPSMQWSMEDSFEENYVEEMQAFIGRIDGKETIGATGAEGLAVLDICLEVRKQAGL